MEPIDPRPNPALVPDGSKPQLIADQQPEYATLPSIVTPKGTVITRWRPTTDERRRIAEGEDIFLAIATFGEPLQPLRMSVGPEDWT